MYKAWGALNSQRMLMQFEAVTFFFLVHVSKRPSQRSLTLK